MIRGLYSAASGMIAQEIFHAARTNNLANIDTVGFKGDTPTFKSFIPYEIVRYSKNEYTPIGKMNMGVKPDGIYTDFEEGKIRETGNPLDLAIHGDGFFVVSYKGGEAYTRAGNFVLSQNGELETVDGLKVQGERGNIVIQGKNVDIAEDGSIYVDGELVDRLRIVDFPDKTNLQKMGYNLFRYNGTGTPQPPENFSVKQGALEYPNVNVVKEMVNILEATRIYETNQRVLRMQDETLSRAISELGRVG